LAVLVVVFGVPETRLAAVRFGVPATRVVAVVLAVLLVAAALVAGA